MKRPAFARPFDAPRPAPFRPAYAAALQLERLVYGILEGITPAHPREAGELAAYTNQLLRCLRRSNHCVGTTKARQQGVQAAVWMVEMLIILEDLKECNVERALIGAAIELSERTEDALRAEGSLPPARDC